MTQNEWQDIASAPRDGTVVDLWGAERERYESSRIASCFWHSEEWRHIATIYDDEQPDDYAPLFNVTHWMPLPPSPGVQAMTQHNRETLLALADRYCEALTPSTATKVAYIGEFSFTVEDCDEDGEHFTRRVYVPWDTTKEIMAAIRARATLDPTGEKA